MEVSDGSETVPLREYAKREKLRRIRDAAHTLLEAQPFSEITMRDVAVEARVGEATLFRYVGSKEQLLLLVFGARVEAQLATIETDPRFKPREGLSGPKLVDLICEFFRVRSGLYLEDPLHVTEFVRAGLSPENGMSGLTVEAGDRIRDVVGRLVDYGQSTGVLDARWRRDVVVENCAGAYIHEVLRSPIRRFPTDTFIARLEERLRAQLEPLVVG